MAGQAVKRYAVVGDGYEQILRSPNGDWVRNADHVTAIAALEARAAAAEAEVERLWDAMPYKQKIQLKFPVGARVEMNEEGLSQFPRYEGKTGTVMRHAVDGWSPSVKWDHRKTETSYAYEFLRVIDSLETDGSPR